jgi:sec-independent protein translocase protein TatA
LFSKATYIILVIYILSKTLFKEIEKKMNLAVLGGLGWSEILLIAFVVLILFGGKRIPELMRSLGRGISEFKAGLNEQPTKNPELIEKKNTTPEEKDKDKE